jgi:TolB-like protein
MASLLPDFEYDIFISYRQKDNEYDGWVTDFVNNLKRELNATFKEEVNVYFDANPHDGLLETHLVQDSLKKKLNSLVFIPIISQTYCDPRSFAWQYELCAYNKAVKEDRFGRDIIVQSGNVASRILPVKIHDLDDEDRLLLENELGGALRCIEFIYKSSGVNRPLRSNEDHPQDNLNKTFYRDQINKVANAIKEIISSLRKIDLGEIEIQRGTGTKIKAEETGTPSGINKKTVAISSVFILLLIIGIIFIPGLLVSKKTLAVLPFFNDTPSDSIDYLIRGFEEGVRNNLQTIGDLRVTNRYSSELYRNNRNRSIPMIARKMRVRNILEGSVRSKGRDFEVLMRLVTAKKKEARIWGETYILDAKDPEGVYNTQSNAAKAIAEQLQAEISATETKIIDTKPTLDKDAYEYYLVGQTYWRKLTRQDLLTAKGYFERAREKDPNFALAYAGLSDVWLAMGSNGYFAPDSAGQFAVMESMRALMLDSNLYQVHYSLGLLSYLYAWDWKSAEDDFLRTIKLNSNHAEGYAHYANLLNIKGRTREAQKYAEKAVSLDPLNPLVKAIYAVNLLFARKYNDAIEASREALELDPTNPVSLFASAFALQKAGRPEEALKTWKESYINTFQSYETIYGIKIAHAFEKGYAKGGLSGALKAEADTILYQMKDFYFNPSEISTMLLAAGESERALPFFKKAFELHDPNVVYVLLPLYDDLRDNPEFQGICKSINLPYE